MGGGVAGWVGGAFWVEETAMPRLQAKGRGEAAELEGARELQRSVYWLSRGMNTVSGMAGDLRKPCLRPGVLGDCLASSVRKLYSWFLFFLFPFSSPFPF